MNTQQNKIALVTGATRGIGLETVRQLARAGVHTLLAGRRYETALALAQELQAEGLPVEALEGHDGPWAMGEVEGLALVFIPRPARPGESPVVVFSLDGGIDDHAEALVAKGVEIVVPVSESPDGGLSLDFLDPDGNVLSLHQPEGAPRRR